MAPDLPHHIRPVPWLKVMWDFESEGPSPSLRWEQMRALLRGRRAPRSIEIIPPSPRVEQWAVVFVFTPDGRAASHHRYTLSRIRDLGLAPLIVCACEEPGRISDDFRTYAEALYWKSLPGFDFSGYAIGLRGLASRAPGATALVVNDSVFGPFHDVTPFVSQPSWELSGFTASATSENHVQSYGFVLTGITQARLRALRPVFPMHLAFNDLEATILRQELRMARVASRQMRVGAYWYSDAPEIEDPSLQLPFELIAGGMPFLKRSLLGKHARFQPRERILDFLRDQDHPVE